MTNQWEIALQKVLVIEHFPRLYLTIKVIETDSAHPLSGPNIICEKRRLQRDKSRPNRNRDR